MLNYISACACQVWMPVAPFTNMVYSACISNHMPSKVWDEIIYPFLNFNSAAVEV